MKRKHLGLRRTMVAAVVAVVLTVFSSVDSAALAAQPPVSPSVQQASAIARPSVVFIQTGWTGWLTQARVGNESVLPLLSRDGSAPRFSVTTSCSGFIANPEGYVMTAGHCVDDQSVRYGGRGLIIQVAVERLARILELSQSETARLLEYGYMNWTVEGTETDSPPDRVVSVFPVRAASGVVVRTPLTANVISYRAFNKGDVAVLKVTSQTPLPALEVAPTTPLASMSQVVAIGYPGSVTSKVDASAEASMKDGTVSGARTVAGVPFTEVSAATSPGMSGGPVVDLQGRVIGTVSWQPGDETQPFNFITNTGTIRDVLASNNVNNVLSPTDRTYRAGLTDYFSGKYHDAARKFDQVLRLEPGHAQAQEYSRLSVANYPNEKTGGWLPLLALIGVGVVVLGLATGITLLLLRRRRRGDSRVPVIGVTGTEPARSGTVRPESLQETLPATVRFATEPPTGGIAIPPQASAPEGVATDADSAAPTSRYCSHCRAPRDIDAHVCTTCGFHFPATATAAKESSSTT